MRSPSEPQHMTAKALDSWMVAKSGFNTNLPSRAYYLMDVHIKPNVSGSSAQFYRFQRQSWQSIAQRFYLCKSCTGVRSDPPFHTPSEFNLAIILSMSSVETVQFVSHSFSHQNYYKQSSQRRGNGAQELLPWVKVFNATNRWRACSISVLLTPLLSRSLATGVLSVWWSYPQTSKVCRAFNNSIQFWSLSRNA